MSARFVLSCGPGYALAVRSYKIHDHHLMSCFYPGIDDCGDTCALHQNSKPIASKLVHVLVRQKHFIQPASCDLARLWAMPCANISAATADDDDEICYSFFKKSSAQVHNLQLVMRWLVVTVVGHSTSAARAAAAVELARDGVGDVAELLLLLVEVLGVGGGTVGLEPLGGLFDGLEKL